VNADIITVAQGKLPDDFNACEKLT